MTQMSIPLYRMEEVIQTPEQLESEGELTE
jgi:hypothetical protein